MIYGREFSLSISYTKYSFVYNVLQLTRTMCSYSIHNHIRNRCSGIAPSLCSAAVCRAHPKYELRPYTPSARHPCLRGSLLEHRVQALLLVQKEHKSF